MHHAYMLTSKGQVTIPMELREQLNLHPGDPIVFEAEGDKIFISKQKNDIHEVFGMYKVNKKVTDDDIQKAIFLHLWGAKHYCTEI